MHPLSLTVRLALLMYFPVVARSAPNPGEVRAAMKRAATYYADEVAVEGGYVYYYSIDLTRRLGDGPATATATEIWVQPPGTPAAQDAGSLCMTGERPGSWVSRNLSRERSTSAAPGSRGI